MPPYPLAWECCQCHQRRGPETVWCIPCRRHKCDACKGLWEKPWPQYQTKRAGVVGMDKVKSEGSRAGDALGPLLEDGQGKEEKGAEEARGDSGYVGDADVA